MRSCLEQQLLFLEGDGIVVQIFIIIVGEEFVLVNLRAVHFHRCLAQAVQDIVILQDEYGGTSVCKVGTGNRFFNTVRLIRRLI